MIVVALVSALCGWFTAYNAAFDPTAYWPYYRGVLPFCILLAAVCVRPLIRIPLAVAGCLLSWRLAFFMMDAMQWFLHSPDDPQFWKRALYWAGPGIVGALGIAAAIGIGSQNIFQCKRFWLIGLVGLLAATIFAVHRPFNLYVGFAVWQAAVGSLIFSTAGLRTPGVSHQEQTG